MNKDELKPCPFCGGEVETEVNYLGQVSIVCKTCGVKVFFIHGDYACRDKGAATDKWNRRADNG